jgi:hypothetical protein
MPDVDMSDSAPPQGTGRRWIWKAAKYWGGERDDKRARYALTGGSPWNTEASNLRFVRGPGGINGRTPSSVRRAPPLSPISQGREPGRLPGHGRGLTGSSESDACSKKAMEARRDPKRNDLSCEMPRAIAWRS